MREPPALIEPRNLRILVAEDNVVNQKVICSMIQREGWTGVLAANGREAYQRFLEEAFDLILMDVQMPEADGLQAARWIREEEARRAPGGPEPRIPIYALTAHALSAQREECLAAGMDAVITKPVTAAALRQAIHPLFAGLSPAS